MNCSDTIMYNNIMAHPGSGNHWEWRPLGEVNPGSGGPWEWRAVTFDLPLAHYLSNACRPIQLQSENELIPPG